VDPVAVAASEEELTLVVLHGLQESSLAGKDHPHLGLGPEDLR
jgi:hypothetical protein